MRSVSGKQDNIDHIATIITIAGMANNHQGIFLAPPRWDFGGVEGCC